MLQRVWSRSSQFNNDTDIAASPLKSAMKVNKVMGLRLAVLLSVSVPCETVVLVWKQRGIKHDVPLSFNVLLCTASIHHQRASPEHDEYDRHPVLFCRWCTTSCLDCCMELQEHSQVSGAVRRYHVTVMGHHALLVRWLAVTLTTYAVLRIQAAITWSMLTHSATVQSCMPTPLPMHQMSSW